MITNVQGLRNITNLDEQATQLQSYIDTLESVEDVSTVLRQGGISEELARTALGQSRNFADDAENIMNVVSASSDAVDNLGQNLSRLPSQTTGLAGIAGSLKAAFVPLLTNPFTYLAIGAAVAGTALYNYITAFDKAVEKTQESQAAYSQAAAEVSSLNSELEQAQSKITALESKGSLTLTEEAELNRLRMQNTELQRQLDLKQQIAEEKSTATVKDAVEALEYERTTDLTYGQKVNGTVNTAKRNTDIITATENEIAALEGLKKERKEVLEKHNNTKDETQRKKYASELESLDESIDTYSSAIQENIGEITELRKSFIDSSTGLMKEGLNAEEKNHYKNMTSVIDQYGSMGLSAEEKQSKAIQSYFSIPGSSLIEDQLRSMAELAGLTAEDITRMGIAIDGVDAQTIANHFNEMAASAREAADATTKFGTLSEYESALQSENAGDDYLKIADGLKNAKDLYDKGLVGTDDFTSYAKMLSPSGADDPESFMQNYERFQTYFNTDSREGIDAFVSDLSKKTNEAGEAFAAFDETTGKWSFNIKATAEAAKEFQMGIAPFEALLGRLKDYGFDIDFQSSLETLDETQTAVGGFDEILDRMAEGDRKDALKKQLEEWRGNLSEWQEDISTLDTDIVMQIKLQYSLAEIQAQIDELRSLIDEGADTVENRAALNAGNQRYIDTAEENLGFNAEGFEVPVAYSVQEEKIEELREKLKNSNLTDYGKLEIQTEITNLQEIQKQLLDEFATLHPEINVESNTEEVQEAWNSFFSESKHSKIDANLGESTLSQLPNKSSIEYEANVDGAMKTVTATKDEQGNITYKANIDNVPTELTILLQAR